ncbi:MAG TPA: glycosyltransferase family 2 protein, partial [Candidatus Paceibacterota bacterium]|nr:glycosyltransferase family 2 protein [Candidatus Paceibacterota bacterium]
MIAKLKKAYSLYSLRNINLWIVFYFLVYLVLVVKLITIKEIDNNILFGLYSLGVSLYLLSRFVIAYLYEVDNKKMRVDYLPTISFGVPAKNEEDNIRETILKMAKSDYPKNKFDIIAVNDGSTDNTLQEMLVAKEIAARHGAVVKVIDWKENRGKREGMAECVKMSKKDLVIFVDSDSFVNQSTARNLVKYFSDPQVVAVAGQAYVTNENKNYLTKMQSVRYYIAFKAYKAAEAMFNSVTCCSGCCSAYRRQAVMEVLA